jgi:hypothetical protein
MSVRIKRTAIFQMDGDGSTTSFSIDLREQQESSGLVGGFSPSGVDSAKFIASGSGTPITISSISVTNFILSVVLASAPANDPTYGYQFTVVLLIDGAV